MAKEKKSATAAEPHDLIADLVGTLNQKSTSETAWLQGDEANSLWGVPIPYLIFAWLNGSCGVIPCQRYIGVSGEEKSFKSTLVTEIGNWFINASGVHLHWDSEHKLNKGEKNTTIDALTWWNGIAKKRARVVKNCASIAEWQDLTTAAIVHNRTKVNPRPPGKRMPVLVTVDSLTGRSTEGADANIRKEGHAEERGYPVAANQVTQYLEALNLLGTTVTVSWVQHMKQAMETDNYGNAIFKEKGAKASQFACSLHLRVSCVQTPIRRAAHPSAPYEGTVEGHTIWISTARTCVGPGKRAIPVDLLWQYTKDPETGQNRQVMWFDWYGALGVTLCRMQYDENFKPKLFEGDKEKLKAALKFSEEKKDVVNCKELGLEGVSYHEFGKAIENNPEVRARIADFLGITAYPSVQDTEIDFEAGDLVEKKSKK